MAKQYRYAPADNRTPVNHPVFGHLEWHTLVENPLAAKDPNFEAVEPKAPKKTAAKKAAAKTESTATPTTQTPEKASEPSPEPAEPAASHSAGSDPAAERSSNSPDQG